MKAVNRYHMVIFPFNKEKITEGNVNLWELPLEQRQAKFIELLTSGAITPIHTSWLKDVHEVVPIQVKREGRAAAMAIVLGGVIDSSKRAVTTLTRWLRRLVLMSIGAGIALAIVQWISCANNVGIPSFNKCYGQYLPILKDIKPVEWIDNIHWPWDDSLYQQQQEEESKETEIE